MNATISQIKEQQQLPGKQRWSTSIATGMSPSLAKIAHFLSRKMAIFISTTPTPLKSTFFLYRANTNNTTSRWKADHALFERQGAIGTISNFVPWGGVTYISASSHDHINDDRTTKATREKLKEKRTMIIPIACIVDMIRHATHYHESSSNMEILNENMFWLTLSPSLVYLHQNPSSFTLCGVLSLFSFSEMLPFWPCSRHQRETTRLVLVVMFLVNWLSGVKMVHSCLSRLWAQLSLSDTRRQISSLTPKTWYRDWSCWKHRQQTIEQRSRKIIKDTTHTTLHDATTPSTLPSPSPRPSSLHPLLLRNIPLSSCHPPSRPPPTQKHPTSRSWDAVWHLNLKKWF